jgi:hypothetical protein
MIRTFLVLLALYCLASTLDFQDQAGMVEDSQSAMHNGLGCFADTECETGEEDADITKQLEGV